MSEDIAGAGDMSEVASADPVSPVTEQHEAFTQMLAAAKEASSKYAPGASIETDAATTDTQPAVAGVDTDTVAKPSAAVRLQALLSSRESNVQQRGETKQIAQLTQMVQQLQAQLQAPKPQVEDPFELFRQDPTKFFERAKMSPEEAQLVQLKAGSPEMVMYQKALAAERRAESVAQQFESFKAELKSEREQDQRAKGEQFRTATESEFLQSAHKATGPMATLAARNPSLALMMGHNVVRQIRDKNPQATCTDADILEYLNSTLDVTASGTDASTGKPIPSQNGAKVPRTLTASRVASERRTTPKLTRDMSENEQEDAMRVAAREAISAKR